MSPTLSQNQCYPGLAVFSLGFMVLRRGLDPPFATQTPISVVGSRCPAEHREKAVVQDAGVSSARYPLGRRDFFRADRMGYCATFHNASSTQSRSGNATATRWASRSDCA